MRDSFKGICLIVLAMCSSLAAAATASLSGTTIPSAAQIVDVYGNVFTLSDGMVYVEHTLTPSSGVILLLSYGGIVYQENSAHLWWLWNPDTQRWSTSVDPRVTSAGGTTVPVATQIIDSGLNVWTLFNGQAYELGKLTPSSGVILLLYVKGVVYQENSSHLWWLWRDGAWHSTSAPIPPSPSGTTIPAAAKIIDNARNVWTLSGGQAYENGAPTPSSSVVLLVLYGGNVFQENVHHAWWEWNGERWKSTASDPRVAQPLAYVASTAAGGGHTVTVIDTGTNHVKATIPIGFEASYMVATPDAKRVYAAGTSSTGYQSVAVIDTAQEKVVATIRVQNDPQEIYNAQGITVSPDGSRVYVVFSSFGYSDTSYTYVFNSTVSAINTATNTVVATINTPDYAVGITISPSGKTLYLPTGTSCECASQIDAAFIDVIDTVSNSLSTEFGVSPLPYAPEGYFIDSVAISPDDAKLYAHESAEGIDDVGILNPVTGTETKKISAGLPVQIFSPDALHLYGVGLGGVGVIDTTTEVPKTAVAGIPGATGVAITPDGLNLYITDVSTKSVLVADTATYTISAVVPLSLAATGAIVIVAAP